MSNQNAKKSAEEQEIENINLDELEQSLQESLETELSDIDFLDEQIAEIGNPDSLGKVIYDTFWEQVKGQFSIQAGEDFKIL